jgi:hypothetical protein
LIYDGVGYLLVNRRNLIEESFDNARPGFRETVAKKEVSPAGMVLDVDRPGAAGGFDF